MDFIRNLPRAQRFTEQTRKDRQNVFDQCYCDLKKKKRKEKRFPRSQCLTTSSALGDRHERHLKPQLTARGCTTSVCMAFTAISSARFPVDYLTFEELGQSARVYQGSGSLANFSRGSSWRTPNHKWHGHSAAVLTLMWAEVRNISGALGRSSRYRGVVDVPPQCDTYFSLLNAPWAWNAKEKGETRSSM